MRSIADDIIATEEYLDKLPDLKRFIEPGRSLTGIMSQIQDYVSRDNEIAGNWMLPDPPKLPDIFEGYVWRFMTEFDFACYLQNRKLAKVKELVEFYVQEE